MAPKKHTPRQTTTTTTTTTTSPPTPPPPPTMPAESRNRFSLAQFESLVDWMEEKDNRDLIYDHTTTLGMTLDAAYERFAGDICLRYERRPSLLGNLQLSTITGEFIRNRWEYFFGLFCQYQRSANQSGEGDVSQPTLSMRQRAARKHKEALFARLAIVFAGNPTITPIVTPNIGYLLSFSGRSFFFFVYMHQS